MGHSAKLAASEIGPWEMARRGARYVVASLVADEAHARLARPLQYLLEKWSGLEQQRRDSVDSLADGEAQVHAVDRALDLALARLARQLETELGGESEGRAHPTFQRFFPVPPEEVIRLGLEHEIDRIVDLAKAAEDTGASAAVRAIVREVQALEAQAGKALAARERATADVARIALRIRTWLESANAAQRSVEGLLSAFATAHDLPDEWTQSFFPANDTAGE
jgi:hypothetical protein